MYTLREVVDSKPAIKSFINLTPDEWRDLILNQMRSGADDEENGRTIARFQLACPEGMVLSSRQAIDEIEARSVLGERVIESEREYLIALLEEVYEREDVT